MKNLHSKSELSSAKILHDAKRFFSGTMLSRISGLLREIATAYACGNSSFLALFFAAFRWAFVFRRLIGESALNTAFIPSLEAIRKHDLKEASIFFIRFSTTLGIVTTILVFFVEVILLSIYGYEGFSYDTRYTIKLIALMLPSLIFAVLYSLYSAFLHCEGSFFHPSVAPVFFNLCWIAIALYIKDLPGNLAMEWLSIGIIIGTAAEMLFLLPRVIKFLQKHVEHLMQHLRLSSIAEVAPIFKKWSYAAIGVSATQINSALDPLFALHADSQGPTYLWYAARIQQIPIGLFAVALSSSLLPSLSKLYQEKNFALFENNIKSATSQILYWITPVTFGLCLCGPLTIELLYHRGNFSFEGVVGTIECLWSYSLGILPTCLAIIWTVSYYACGDYRFPMIVSFISVLLNLLFNSLFIFGLGWGSHSVALATSMCALFNAGILAFHFKNKYNVSLWYARATRLCLESICLSTVAASIALAYTLWSVSSFFVNDFYIFSSLSFWEKLYTFCMQSILFAGSWFGIQKLIKHYKTKTYL